GDRDGAAIWAVHDGNRTAPVTLARDQPVAQPVAGRPLSDASLLDVLGDPRESGFRREAVVRAAVDHRALVADEGLFQVALRTARRGDHLADRQPELRGELEVALVVSRHAHDGAG